MPRKPEPRWKKSDRRWVAAIGEPRPDGRARDVYAPASIREDDKAAAWAWFDSEVRARATVPCPAGDVVLEHLAELYLAWCEGAVERGELAAAHYRAKQQHLTRVSELLGDRRASALTADLVERTLADLTREYSAHYVNNIGATLQAALKWGVRSGKLERNPAEGFRSPTIPRAPERYASRAEAAAWVAWLHHEALGYSGERLRYRRANALLQRCLLHTGARPKELCQLRWEDLRWSSHRNGVGQPYATARIPPDRWKAGGKTGRWRTIYFTPILTRALRREYERPDRHATHVFVHGRGRGGVGACEPWADGSAYSQWVRSARRRLIAFRAAAAELRERGEQLGRMQARALAVEISDEGAQRLTNYRWRHTAASTLLMLGLDPATVGEALGTSAEMVLRVYGHLLDKHVAAAAERLARPKRVS